MHEKSPPLLREGSRSAPMGALRTFRRRQLSDVPRRGFPVARKVWAAPPGWETASIPASQQEFA